MSAERKSEEELKARFRDLAAPDSYAARLAQAGRTNAGANHKRDSILRRSKAAADHLVGALIDASKLVVGR
jgi:hypothetical protein